MSCENAHNQWTGRPSTRRRWALLSLRWVARLTGTAVALLIATIAIGEGGPPNPWSQPWKINLELHLMLVTWVGLLLGWKWEGLGGAMVVGGVLAFSVLEGRMPHAFFGVILPGLIYLCCCYVSRQLTQARCQTDSRLH